jgi:hypothetical protein
VFQAARRAILALVIARPGLLLLLVLIAWLGVPPASGSAEIPTVEIQIGPSQTVRLAPADADAFRRRLSAPPAYSGPLPTGETFVVTSDYWDATLGTGAGAPAIEPAGTYFPADGIVKLRQAGRDAFFVLDQRQRANLDRYIKLVRQGQIGSAPGLLEVLVAASNAEPISIEIGSRFLKEDERAAFWRLAAGFNPLDLPPAEPPRDSPSVVWITFGLPEGRSVLLGYAPGSGTVFDTSGREVYGVPKQWLQPILGDYAPKFDSFKRQIEQQEPHGSLLWWPVMLGGGVGLLAAAVWLRRRWS